jgi:flavin-dependent dehydrogenase
VQSDQVQAVVIERFALDQELVRRAAAAGAEVHQGSRAERVRVDAGGVSVQVRGFDRPVRARAAVLACGANYQLHRDLGLDRPEVFLQSVQMETGFPDVPEVEVRFGREVAPGGFGWLVPFRRAGVSCARIGLMSEDRAPERFESLLGTLCARAGVDRPELPAPRRKMLPLGPVSRTYADRVIAVGDAAGLVKPTTGGGIYYGLLSGAIGAEVLAEGLTADRLSAGFLRRYESRWRRRLGREIRTGLMFRRIAARLNDRSIDALIDLARVNGIVPLLEQHASFNWHGRAAVALLAHPSFSKIVAGAWHRDQRV